MNELVKDTEGIIRGNRAFFNLLEDINRVIVVGHSFSLVDFPYMKEIVQRTGTNVPWAISYHTEDPCPESENIYIQIFRFVCFDFIIVVRIYDREVGVPSGSLQVAFCRSGERLLFKKVRSPFLSAVIKRIILTVQPGVMPVKTDIRIRFFLAALVIILFIIDGSIF